jgi:hypothetical protein
MEKYDELEQYIRSQEPDTKERAAMWQKALTPTLATWYSSSAI